MTLDHLAELARLEQLEARTVAEQTALDFLCRLTHEEGRETEAPAVPEWDASPR